jgi:hypothetical protein
MPASTAMHRDPPAITPVEAPILRSLRKKEIYADGEEWIGRGS